MKDSIYSDNEYFSEEDKKRLSRILMMSRAESGMSQEKLALELGVAKKTIQNWEKGSSAPTLPQSIQWFRVLKVPAMPYFLQFMFPDMECVVKEKKDDDIRTQLTELIKTLPPESIHQLMYLFYGDHGSSPRGIMNLITAHLQSPMRDRYSHASTILNDYELSVDKEKVSRPDHVQPNVDLLEKAIKEGRDAVVNDRENYMVVGKDSSSKA